MASASDNELMTTITPGSPAGDLMRRYWQPAALVDEFESERAQTERAVVPVTLLGEELVMFRNEDGSYGLVDRYCAHRGADLAYGRQEDGGLRCPFHGWLFDAAGSCLEQPAEPEISTQYKQVRHRAYPCRERNGIVFAYMGPGEPPAFPEFDCFAAPRQYTFAFKGMWECNWLQALEVGIDPAHASYLHRFFEDEAIDDAYGKQFRSAAADTDVPLTRILREYSRPTINVEDTDYGLRLVTTRELDDERTHFRVTNLLFPLAITIPMSNEMTITQWHVPIDNTRCYWYAIFTSFGDPVDHATMRAQRLEMHTLPDYRPILNRSNNWGFNAEEQRSKTYTGMGMDINVHDQWAVESMGPIQDRTRERLALSDIGIITYRRLLKKAIAAVQEQQPVPFVLPEQEATAVHGPVAIDAIVGGANGDTGWKERDLMRRDLAGWGAPNPWREQSSAALDPSAERG